MQGYKDEPKEKIMATDQFGNPLSEEEEYRLILEQQRMGLRPHPVRVKGASSPFSSAIQTPASYTPSPTMDIGMLPYSPTAEDVPNMAGPLPGRFLAPPGIMRPGPGYDPRGVMPPTLPINPDDPNIELWQSIDEGRQLAGPTPGKFLGPLGSDYTEDELNTPVNEWPIPDNVVPLNPELVLEEDGISVPSLGQASTALGTLIGVESLKRGAELKGLIKPTHTSIYGPKTYERLTGKKGLPIGKVLQTGVTAPAAWVGGGLPMMMYSSDAYAPTTGATQEEMLALQRSLMDRTSEPTETPVGFATETSADTTTGYYNDPEASYGSMGGVAQANLPAPNMWADYPPLSGNQLLTDIEQGNINASNITQGPGMATSWGDKFDTYADAWGKINQMGNAGMLSAPEDFSSPFMDSWDHPYMSSQDAAYSQGLKQQLADDLFGPLGGLAYAGIQVPDEGFKAAKDVVSGKLFTPQQENAGWGGFLAQMVPALGIEDGTALATINDAWASANVDDFSALANPNIKAEDAVAAFEEEQAAIAEMRRQEDAAIAQAAAQAAQAPAQPSRGGGSAPAPALPAAVPSVAQIIAPRTTAKAKAVQKRQQKKAAPKKTTKILAHIA